MAAPWELTFEAKKYPFCMNDNKNNNYYKALYPEIVYELAALYI